MSAVTEGIDAIATTRVVIHRDSSHTSTHATGETVHRAFRCRYLLYLIVSKNSEVHISSLISF